MERYKIHIRALAVIFLLAVPALTIRVISDHNEDMYLLPLAPANDSRIANSESRGKKGFARIDVQVDWPQDGSDNWTQAELRDRIADVLKRQTAFYKIEFVDQPIAKIGVTFTVGPNRYGPFSPGEEMVEGIRTALVALRMTNGPEKL